jgi:DNA-binding transcriptional LysR family regulator
MLTRRHLECLVAVAEELHFSRAGERLGVAQSAVSVQIQQLENKLGVRLLHRGKRQPISLTDAGMLLYAEAVAALRHLERAENVAVLAAKGMSGSVRLGYVASAVSSGLLSRMLAEFRPGHEAVHMQVLAMETPRQLMALDAEEIDVGIVRPRRRYPDGIEAVVVHSEPLMVALPQTHHLARNATVAAKDLRDQTFVSPQFDDAEGFAEVIGKLAAIAGFAAAPAYRVNDFITATSMAAAGYGIVVVPESIQLLRQPGVTFRPIKDFKEQVHLALAYRRRESSPAVRSFLDVARGRRKKTS